MDNPKVSIIVPIYRVEEYIERCAESLFAQTFDDIEYIFVDDCSPDKSVEILQRTLEKYPHRKRLTRIERLSGGAARRPGGGVLKQGGYHQIKRMFGVYGAGVNGLHRDAIGGLALDENLAPGQWRELSDDEVAEITRG